MANYVLTFHFVDGRHIRMSAKQKPEDITDLVKSLTDTSYQAFFDGSTAAALVNMQNVTVMDIEKEGES